jgi:hypothetical protein
MVDKFISIAMHYLGALLGGFVVFACFFIFFHFETWLQRISYFSVLGFFIALLYLLLPKRFR